MKDGAIQLMIDGVVDVRSKFPSTLEIAKRYGLTQWDVYHVFRLYSKLTGYKYEELLYQPKSIIWTGERSSKYSYDGVNFTVKVAEANLAKRTHTLESSLFVAKLMEETVKELIRRYQ